MQSLPRADFALFTAFAAFTALLFAIVLTTAGNAFEKASMQDEIRVVNYVTLWSLDPAGYHPAILIKIENASTHDLTGQSIRLQGRFMDIHTTEVTVARAEQRAGFRSGQRMVVWLKAPAAYELPITSNSWPAMECKVMCRVGNVNDDQTQTLVITDVGRVAMSDEDARDQLEKLKEYTQTPPPHETSTPTRLGFKENPSSGQAQTASIAQSRKPAKSKKPESHKRNAT